jgi:hypothetical protein
VGQAMADLLARYGNKNVRDIFGRTAARLQDSEAAIGAHPRVLKTVIEEGSFATDEAAQEYFAGLLASSLSAGSENDEAITFLNLVRNLSVAEIKLHHLIYSLKRILHNPKYFPPIPADVSGELFLPHQLLVEQAGIHTVPARRHALHGLVQQGLISPSFDASSRSFDPSQQGTFDGITLAGTDFGAELFLWVHGARGAAPESVCSTAQSLNAWTSNGLTITGAAGRYSLSQQHIAAAALRDISNLCSQVGGNVNTIELLNRWISGFMRDRYRYWTPRAFRAWLNEDLNPITDKGISEFRQRVGTCIALLNVPLRTSTSDLP